jgi:hypothetical protein
MRDAVRYTEILVSSRPQPTSYCCRGRNGGHHNYLATWIEYGASYPQDNTVNSQQRSCHRYPVPADNLAEVLAVLPTKGTHDVILALPVPMFPQ